jgi:hypothetical protein
MSTTNKLSPRVTLTANTEASFKRNELTKARITYLKESHLKRHSIAQSNKKASSRNNKPMPLTANNFLTLSTGNQSNNRRSQSAYKSSKRRNI